MLVRLFKLFTDVGKIDDVSVAKIHVGAVDAGQCLQQVVLTDHPPEVELLQPFCIKASEQHVMGEQQVNLARFEILYPSFALFLANHIVQDQRTALYPIFKHRFGGVTIGLPSGDQGLCGVLRCVSRLRLRRIDCIKNFEHLLCLL